MKSIVRSAPGRKSSTWRTPLFVAWAAWVWLAWAGSPDLADAHRLPGVLRYLMTPPWPFAGAAAIRILLGLAGAATVFLATAAFGAPVLATLGLRPRWLPYRVAAGIPLLGMAVHGLGLLGLSRPGVLVALAGGAGALALAGLKPARPEGWAASAPWMRLVIVLSASAVLLGACAPETAWDAVVYHLRVPALYLLAGRITPMPELFMSCFPFNGESLSMLAMTIGGDAAARALHALFWLACGAGIARLAKGAWGAPAAGWAAVLWFTVPFGMALASRAYVEYVLLLPMVAALCLIHVDTRRWSPRRTFLAGWFAGAVVGTKYTGAIVAAVLLFPVLRRGRGAWGTACRFSGAGALACGHWFLRNLVWTGNPVYPLVRGGLHWTAADTIGWKNDAAVFMFQPAALLSPATYLLGTTWDGAFPHLLLLGVVSPLVWPALRRRWMWTTMGALYLAWWSTSAITRYLVPVVAIACIATAGMVSGHGPAEGVRRRLGAVLIAGVWLSWLAGVKAIEFGTGAFDVALGKISERESRTRYYVPRDYSGMLDAVGPLVGPRDRVYVMGYPFCHGLRARAWCDTRYVRPPLYWWLDGADSPERIAVRARQAGLTTLAVYPAGAHALFREHGAFMDWQPAKLRAWKTFWATRTREVARLEHWRIRVIGPARRGPPAGEAAPWTE